MLYIYILIKASFIAKLGETIKMVNLVIGENSINKNEFQSMAYICAMNLKQKVSVKMCNFHSLEV